jgi:hypothetical protein
MMNDIQPFEGEGTWYKGNLHCHSTNSDGKLPPEQVVEFYKHRGYDFMAFTEHHLFTDQAHLSDEQFIIIPGLELSLDQERMPKSEHFNGFQIKPSNGTPYSGGQLVPGQTVPPRLWNTRYDVQDAIDTLQQRGLAVTLNHPSWSRTDRETLLNAGNYFAIEIYNHTSEYDERLGFATDLWDFLLRRGRKIWGMAVDDAHYYDTDRADGGWVMVKSKEFTHESLMESLLSGRFYSSSGPEIRDIRIEDGEVIVECSPVNAIHFITYERRGKSIRANGNGPLTSARWTLHGDELYVRVECEDFNGKSAWSNPMYYNSEFLKYVNEDYLS